MTRVQQVQPEPLASDVSVLGSISGSTPLNNAASAAQAVTFGRYTITRQIGRGGFGQVFLAVESTTWEPCAIKTLNRKRRSEASAVQRFEREIRIGRELQHPNILPIIDDGEIDGVRYFATPFVEGMDVLHVLGKKPMAVSDAVGIAREVAQAVAIGHKHGYLHRDIKPANILIDSKSGRPFVADFGLAKQFSDPAFHTETLAVVGTQAYMPPEQADPHLGDVSPAVDIYAIGVTLYQMLTGRTPFPRQDKPGRDILLQIAWDRPLPPSKLNPQVPAELDRLCMICLEKHPFDRYSSAEELADDLGRFEQGVPIRAREPSRTSRALRRCRRQPILAASVAALLALSALGAAAAWYFAGEVARQSQEIAGYAPTLEKAATDVADANQDKQIAEAAAKTAARTKAAQAYATDLRQVAVAWKAGDVVRVGDLLERHVPTKGEVDLRGFEWYFWEKRLRTVCRRLTGQPPFVGLALSENGSLLAASGEDRLSVWDAGTGTPLFQRDIGPGRGSSYLYSIDQPYNQRTAVSPDGTLIGVTYPGKDGGSIRVWDRSGVEKLARASDRRLSGAALTFSPDGRYLVASGMGGAWLSWNTQTLAEDAPETSRQYGREIENAHLHPTKAVWFAGAGELHTFTHDVQVWGWGSEGCRRIEQRSRENTNWMLAVSPALEVLTAPAQEFGIPFTGRSTNARPLDPRVTPKFATRLGDRVIAACSDSILREWSVPLDDRSIDAARQEFRGAPSEVQAVAHSKFRTAAACADGTICIWPGGPDPTRETPEANAIPDAPKGVYPSPSGKRCATFDSDAGTVTISCAPDQPPVIVPVRKYILNAVQWSEDDRFIALYSSNQGRGLNVAQVDRSVKSRIILVDADNRSVVTEIPSGDGLNVTAMVFSPDGATLCVGTRRNGTSLYQASNGSLVKSFDIHGWYVRFSVTGHYLAMSDDHRLGVWNTTDGQWAVTPDHEGGRVNFDPAERRAFVSTFTGAKHILEIELASGATRKLLRSNTLLEYNAVSTDGSRMYATDTSLLQVFATDNADGEPLLHEHWANGLPSDDKALTEKLDTLMSAWIAERRARGDR